MAASGTQAVGHAEPAKKLFAEERETAAMNLRRGLFRLWLVVSALWVVFAVAFDWRSWSTAIGCLLDDTSSPWCKYWDLSDYAQGFLISFGPPFALFGIGAGLLWAAYGFVRDQRPN